MSDPTTVPQKRRPHSHEEDGSYDAAATTDAPSTATNDLVRSSSTDNLTSAPPTPGLISRTPSFSGSSSEFDAFGDADDLDAIPPLDRLTVFDFLENLALPQRLERLSHTLSAQTAAVRRAPQRLASSSKVARDKVADEWRRRVPAASATADERLAAYRRRVRAGVDRFGARWRDGGGALTTTTREKASFIAGVLNIFVSGYLVGAAPEWFHWWYTAQLCYFYPVRYVVYRRKGYHYFLADLCYFVNFLLLLSIWVFPQSKRLFISTFCLAFGNNAVAIAMWRNSMVFHSLDKITRSASSPPLTLVCRFSPTAKN